MNYDDNNPPTEACEEDIATRAAREFAINLETATELVAWIDKEIGASQDTRLAEQLHHKFLSAFRALIDYQANQGAAKDVRMATRVMALALGFTHIAGKENGDHPCDIVSLAREMGYKKQTPSHCLNYFVNKLGLPPLTGQRNKQSKKLMSLSRKKQLQH